jgi:hypothetical protein
MPGPEDPTLAEAFALYNAIHLAKDCGFQDVHFECDCASVISLIRDSDCNPRSYVDNAIRGIHSTRTLFRNCSFKHIHREANRAAHLLASLAHDELNKVRIEEIPPQLVTTLIRDSIH